MGIRANEIESIDPVMKFRNNEDYFVSLATLVYGSSIKYNSLYISAFGAPSRCLLHGKWDDRMMVEDAEMDKDGNFKIWLRLTNKGLRNPKKNYRLLVESNVNGWNFYEKVKISEITATEELIIKNVSDLIDGK